MAPVRALCDAGCVTRVALGLAARALAGSEEGGRVALAATRADDGTSRLTFEHGVAEGLDALWWVMEAARDAVAPLGGKLTSSGDGQRSLVELSLPGERAP